MLCVMATLIYEWDVVSPSPSESPLRYQYVLVEVCLSSTDLSRTFKNIYGASLNSGAPDGPLLLCFESAGLTVCIIFLTHLSPASEEDTFS